jgi:hypothetical protein
MLSWVSDTVAPKADATLSFGSSAQASVADQPAAGAAALVLLSLPGTSLPGTPQPVSMRTALAMNIVACVRRMHASPNHRYHGAAM